MGCLITLQSFFLLPHRIVFAKLLQTMSLATGLLCFFLFAQKALCYITLVTEYGLTILDFLLLISFWIPDILLITLPFTLFYAVIMVYRNLRLDKTLIIFFSFGSSPMFLLKPLIFLASIFSVFLMVLNLYVSPLCLRSFLDFERYISETLSERYVKEKNFSAFKNFVLYTHGKEKNGHLKGLFLFMEKRATNEKIFLTASSAFIEPGETNLKVSLKNGMRESFKGSERSLMAFNSYEVFLPKTIFSLERPPRLYELSTYHLLQEISMSGVWETIFELYKRISLSFISFSLAIFGGFLALFLPSVYYNSLLFIASLLGGGWLYFGTNFFLRIFARLSWTGFFFFIAYASLSFIVLLLLARRHTHQQKFYQIEDCIL